MTIGERLKIVRKSNNLNQNDFSKKLGISQTHVSKIENNVENPSNTLLRLIALEFNVPIEWLEKGEGNTDIIQCFDYYEQNNPGAASQEGQYITVKEAADLLTVSERAVQLSVDSGKYATTYTPGKGRGGRQLRIALDSLPRAAQVKYYEQKGYKIPREIGEPENLEEYTVAQIQEAMRKGAAVRCYWRSGLSVKKFLEKYNEENGGNITEDQLRSWEKKFKQSGHSTESLIDKRGGNRKADSIPPEAWDFFLSCILTPQNRSVQLCYDITKEQFPDMTLPSVRTFQRRFKDVPELLKMKAAGRKDAYMVCHDSLERNYTTEHSNSVWVLDHHLSDVLVRTERGNITRLWLTAAMDAHSRKVMSIVARDQPPNAIAIKKGLRIAMMEYGVPETLLTDNGKDYKSKSFDNMIEGLKNENIKVETIRAIPYHGQSKMIERFFGTLEERFGKRWYSYAGSNAKDRPDYLKKTNKELEKDPNIPTMDEFIQRLEGYIVQYNETVHTGNGMNGRTPNEAYQQGMQEVRTIDPYKLTMVCGEITTAVVGKNGVQLMNRHYQNKEGKLAMLFGKRVTLRYIPENIDVLFVYDENDCFYCKCTAKTLTPYRTATMDDYRESQRLKKAVNKALNEQMPKGRKMSIIESVAALQYKEKYGIPPLDVDVKLGSSNEAAEQPEEQENITEDYSFDPFGDNAVNQ